MTTHRINAQKHHFVIVLSSIEIAKGEHLSPNVRHPFSRDRKCMHGRQEWRRSQCTGDKSGDGARARARRAAWLTCAGELVHGYLIHRRVLQARRPVAARAARRDVIGAQPIREPGQVAVAVERVGHQVSANGGPHSVRQTLVCKVLPETWHLDIYIVHSC